VTPGVLEVSIPLARTDNGRSVVSSLVDGAEAWFASADVELEPAPEAFPSAFLVPSLGHRMPLLSRSALSAEWLANVDRPLQLYAEWWGYPRLLPVARRVDRMASIGDVGLQTPLCRPPAIARSACSRSSSSTPGGKPSRMALASAPPAPSRLLGISTSA
jgi:hypothetical protein